MIRTIVCPVDLTERSCQAVRMARDLAMRLDARVVLHHDVAAAPPSPMGVAWMWSEDHEAETEGRTADATGKLEELLVGLPPGSEAKLTRGPLEESVQQVVRDVGADLLLIGSRGRRSPGDESLTERLTLKAPCAVLALGDRCHQATLWGEKSDRDRVAIPIVVPTDFTRRSLVAVEYAFLLAERLPVLPQLVHVCSEKSGAEVGANVRAAEQRLRSLIPTPLASRVGVSAVPGEPALSILDRTDATGARCILLASHRRGPLRRAVFGTTALAVLRASEVPVWFVHEPTPGARLRDLLERSVK